MPGDPLRAQYIAETYLKKTELINTVRNMLGFTGEYNGTQVTVFGSGMGLPSVGIYSYELYNFYDVENIVRVGSAGAYTSELKLFDILVASDSWSESTYVKTQNSACDDTVIPASESLSDRLVQSAKKLGITVARGRIHAADVFYRERYEDFEDIYRQHGCIAADMDSVALFHNARTAGKHAATIVTISDVLPTHEAASIEERRSAFNSMIKIALGIL
jgi:purine-nucleoside phosphorylase